MKRREFLASAGVAWALTRTAGAQAAQRPNLLVIQTDEHNFRTLGCYRNTLPKNQALMWGDAVVETPNLDWIAENGALCTSFYATTPVCSPSRSALVSGQHPQNTPIYTNDIPMNDDIITYAELLRRQGYATGYAGKWHLDGPGKPQWTPERKFGFEDNLYMYNRGHWKKLEDTPNGPRVAARNDKGAPTYDVAGADEKSFTTDFLADKAVDFINAHAGKPFCYHLSFPDPHGPDRVRTPYDTMFKDQEYVKPRTFNVAEDEAPSWGTPNGRWEDMALYYGMVKCIDDNVGKVLNALRAKGILDNTIVVFTADHGDLRGEHHRQNKGVPYEGSAKIPFLIYYKGKIKPGTIVRQALDCTDFLPTVLALMQAPTAGREEGRDASELFLTGKAPAGWDDITFFRSTGANPGWLAAVTPRYKLIYAPNDPPYLFDLEKDPDELENRFQDPACRDTVRRMARALIAYAKRCNDNFADDPGIRAGLTWSAEGEGEYPKRPLRRGRTHKETRGE